MWTESIAYSYNRESQLYDPSHQALRVAWMQYLSDELGCSEQREVALG